MECTNGGRGSAYTARQTHGETYTWRGHIHEGAVELANRELANEWEGWLQY